MLDPKQVEMIALISSSHHRAITELLIEKGVFTKDELRRKAIELSKLSEDEFAQAIEYIGK